MSDIQLNYQAGPTITLNESDNNPLITFTQSGAQGSQGPAGHTITLTALEALGGDRAVTSDGRHCHPPDDLHDFAGITTSSSVSGDIVEVKRFGPHRIIGAEFTPKNPVFIGPNGTLIQNATAPPLRRIGWAISADTINLDPQPIIGA